LLVNFFFHLLFGSIISVVIFILRLIPSTRSGAKVFNLLTKKNLFLKIAHWFLRLFPSFSFAYGILGATNKVFYQVTEGYKDVKSSYDIDISNLLIYSLSS